jgi:hypothetical protein
MDTTPFGQGKPYSRSQLRRLMRETLFSPEGWAETLYVPPLPNWVFSALRGAGSASADALAALRGAARAGSHKAALPPDHGSPHPPREPGAPRCWCQRPRQGER